MKLFTTDAEITKSIKSIEGRSAKLRTDIHKTGCSILRVWNKSGDYRPALAQLNLLHNALGGAIRTNAFKDWVVAHTGFEWDNAEKAFTHTQNKIADDMVRSAIDKPFWDFSPEKEYKPMEWAQMLAALVKKAEKDLSEMGEASKVDAEQLAAIKALQPAKEG